MKRSYKATGWKPSALQGVGLYFSCQCNMGDIDLRCLFASQSMHEQWPVEAITNTSNDLCQSCVPIIKKIIRNRVILGIYTSVLFANKVSISLRIIHNSRPKYMRADGTTMRNIFWSCSFVSCPSYGNEMAYFNVNL